MAIVFDRADATELSDLCRQLEAQGAEAALRWADEQFAPDLTLACSFGGPSGMALLDMTWRLGLDIEVFYLETGLLFPQTRALREEVERRYGIRAAGYEPGLSLIEQGEQYGEALWARNPDLCCALRKLEPTRRALAGKQAWISGIRRDQTANRADTQVVEWDDRFGLIKVNPLASWTEDQVWDYIREHDVPYNALHEEGYASIGCQPCTRPIQIGESVRSGRWTGFEKTECGLHLPDREDI